MKTYSPPHNGLPGDYYPEPSKCELLVDSNWSSFFINMFLIWLSECTIKKVLDQTFDLTDLNDLAAKVSEMLICLKSINFGDSQSLRKV
jgi:hypothetical protein